MLFLLAATLVAMAINLAKFWQQGLVGLLLTGGTLFVLAIWLTVEAALAVRRYQKESPVKTLDVDFRY